MNDLVLTILKLSAILGLVLINAFFVSCEFAIVKVRRTRINTLAQQGDFRAKIAEKIISQTTAYLSGAQVGITIASLGLGWLGEPFVAHILNPLFKLAGLTNTTWVSGISTFLGFSIITAAHIVLGEQAPKAFSIEFAEKTCLWIALPFHAFYKVFYPVIWILNTASNLTLKMLRLPPADEKELSLSPEELRIIVTESGASGQLSAVGTQLMQRVLTFTTRTVKDIMIPRTNIIAIDIHENPETIMDIVIESGYSRMPVFDQTLDRIMGIVYTKDLLAASENRSLIHVSDIMRPAYFIPESMKVGQLLREFQKRKIHMAIVVDEYGMTSGLATLEDVVEEIVGEIQDEYDTEEERIQKMADGSIIVDGTMSTNDLTQYHGIHFPDSDDFESVGGFILSKLGKIPTGGETIQYRDHVFIVADVHQNRVNKVKIIPRKAK
jgi:CBS domain containing-hemolysin-like protein